MIKKKVLMLGSYAVGKTSLVKRYVYSIFSEKYHTTIGVKIDQKDIAVDSSDIRMIIWDIHGEDEFQKIHSSYFTGASGFLLVIDCTRKSTLAKAIELQKYVYKTAGEIPFILVMNKIDLHEEYDINEQDLKAYLSSDIHFIKTSAKTGEGVEEAFQELAKLML